MIKTISEKWNSSRLKHYQKRLNSLRYIIRETVTLQMGRHSVDVSAPSRLDLEHIRRNYASEHPVTYKLHSEIGRDDVLWDIGAAFGGQACIYATTGSEVFAIEAEPLRFAYADRNGRNLANLNAVQCRVGSDTPDDDLPNTNPTALTIDVEGAEVEVLDRLDDCLDDVRVLVVEVHPGVDEDEIKEQLGRHGFDVQTIHERTHNSFLWGER